MHKSMKATSCNFHFLSHDPNGRLHKIQVMKYKTALTLANYDKSTSKTIQYLLQITDLYENENLSLYKPLLSPLIIPNIFSLTFSLISYKIKQQQNVIKQIYTKQPENNDKEKNKNGDRNLTGWKFIELTE